MKNAGCTKKVIGRSHSTVYYNAKILQEETCKQAMRRKRFWGFLGIEEMGINEFKSDT